MLAQGELHALRDAAEKAWDDDTRHPHFVGHPQPSAGQCYVTASWLAGRLGGTIGHKKGHFFWISPGKKYALDLTGDSMPTPPVHPRFEGARDPSDPEDEGIHLQPHHKVWKPGPVIFKKVDHPMFAGYEEARPLENERAVRFAQRADHYFDHPNEMQHHALDYMGDGLPANEPQATEDRDDRYFHDDIGDTMGGEYNFVYANGGFEVSPFHSHEDLASHIGVAADHTGPFATGTIEILDGGAFWRVTGNVSPKALMRAMKDYTKAAGWSWGGLTSIDGTPIDDELFMGKSSRRVYFAYTDAGDFVIVHRKGRLSTVDSRIIGYLDVVGHYTKVQTLRLPEYPLSLRHIAFSDMRKVGAAVLDWCEDNSLSLIAQNDNVIKTIEDLDLHNLYDPMPTQEDDHQYPVTYPQQDVSGGTYKCQHCEQVFPTYDDLTHHQLQEEGENPTVEGTSHNMEDFHDGNMPELRDPDNPGPSNRFADQFPYVSYVHRTVVDGFGLPEDREGDQYLVAYRSGPSAALQIRGNKISGFGGRQRDVVALMAKFSAEPKTPKPPKDNSKPWSPPKQEPVDISAPIPFIYDIQDDTITFGQPGQRTSDVPGKFTPGGIVDGVYNPDGKIVIHTFTNMPWTANYFLRLFYSYQPTLQVKSLHLQDDGGGDTKLAGSR